MSLNKYRVRLSKNDQKLKIRSAWFKTGTMVRSKLINLKKEEEKEEEEEEFLNRFDYVDRLDPSRTTKNLLSHNWP